MAKRMNKKEFLELLEDKTNLNKEQCIILNDILESNFIIGKNNKEKILNEIKEKLSLNQDEAEKVYEISMNIISSEIRNKIIHPFK